MKAKSYLDELALINPGFFIDDSGKRWFSGVNRGREKKVEVRSYYKRVGLSRLELILIMALLSIASAAGGALALGCYAHLESTDTKITTSISANGDLHLQRQIDDISHVLKSLVHPEQFGQDAPSDLEREAPKGQPEREIVKIGSLKANLRAKPSADSEVLFSLDKGTELIVRDAKDGWSRVIGPKGESAWIKTSLIEEEASSR